MKNNLLSVSALVLSVVTCVYLAVSYSGFSFDFAPFLVAVLTLLTAILLGWQVYNYLTFEERIKKMREELTKEVEQARDDAIHIVEISNQYTLASIVGHILKSEKRTLQGIARFHISALELSCKIDKEGDGYRQQCLDALEKDIFQSLPSLSPEHKRGLFQALLKVEVASKGKIGIQPYLDKLSALPDA